MQISSTYLVSTHQQFMHLKQPTGEVVGLSKISLQ